MRVGNRLYYPRSFLVLDRGTVAIVCREPGALGTISLCALNELADGPLFRFLKRCLRNAGGSLRHRAQP